MGRSDDAPHLGQTEACYVHLLRAALDVGARARQLMLMLLLIWGR